MNKPWNKVFSFYLIQFDCKFESIGTITSLVTQPQEYFFGRIFLYNRPYFPSNFWYSLPVCRQGGRSKFQMNKYLGTPQVDSKNQRPKFNIGSVQNTEAIENFYHIDRGRTRQLPT